MAKDSGDKRRKRLEDEAARHTVALNPMVGIRSEELWASTRRTFFRMLTEPAASARVSLDLAYKLAAVASGRKTYDVPAKDRRFADPAWRSNPMYRSLLQAYLAFDESLDEWVEAIDFDELEARRARVVTRFVSDMLAPSNNLFGNPAAMKRLVDTGGESLLAGLRNLASDLLENGGMPSMVDKTPFEVGRNLAATPGQVVLKTEMFELIQYAAATGSVRKRATLIVPPQINKYYVMDLTPDKSLPHYLCANGIQTFAISWRNPQKQHADWGIDAYVDAVRTATTAVSAITKRRKVNLLAACSGGLTASILAGYCAARGEDVVASLTLMVCVLVHENDDSDLGMFVDDRTIELARAASRRQGVLSGADLNRTFAWMRPNDLVWNYVVNNYLLGEDPPAFDILFWNADSTNLPARLHSDFLDISQSRALARPGDLSVLDTPIDLSRFAGDAYVVAGITDHITPWEACYRTTHVLGGNTRFVLAGSGHVQTLTAAPGKPKARYYRNDNLPATAAAWFDGADRCSGSWWPEWLEWLKARSGEKKKAPKKLGNKAYPALCPAPGEYVREAAA